MFNESKYTNWYFNIINKAKTENRKKFRRNNRKYIYYESHHIIPKSMGGTEEILLTAREHFICHWCLTRMCIVKEHTTKMRRAFGMMIAKNKHQTRKTLTSIQYEAARKARSVAMVENNPMSNPIISQKVALKNRKTYDEKFDSETVNRLRKEQSERMTGANHPLYGKNHPNKGKMIHSEEFKMKLSKPKPQVQCPHCRKIGGKPVMMRYHFDKCKLAPTENLRRA